MRLSNSVKHNSSLSENWAGVSKDPQETIVFLTKSPKVKLSDFPPDFPRLQKGTPRFFRHGDLQYLPRGGEFAGELSGPGARLSPVRINVVVPCWTHKIAEVLNETPPTTYETMVDVGNFHIPLGPLMIIDGVFNSNVNPGFC